MMECLRLSASLMLMRTMATRKAKPARARQVAATMSFQFLLELLLGEDGA